MEEDKEEDKVRKRAYKIFAEWSEINKEHIEHKNLEKILNKVIKESDFKKKKDSELSISKYSANIILKQGYLYMYLWPKAKLVAINISSYSKKKVEKAYNLLIELLKPKIIYEETTT